MAAKEAYWEHFPHGADIGVRGVAPTLEGAFEQAALALTAIVVDPASLHADEAVEISCDAPDRELLLVDWLNALVYEMATRRMLFGRFEVGIDGTRLHAKAWGEPMDLSRLEMAVEPKGATYTALSVRQDAGAWIAECVVDV
ncbi:MAG TPA: archease [Dehalococcoidia bacterium]|nr:archease [Dehalococcoidia bacterium]